MNREKQKAHWDAKYEQGLPSLTKPDPFFIFAYERFVEPSFPNAGVALDLACGLGRHALYLANRSWRVCGVDFSDVAIAKLNHAALESNVNLDLFVGDASAYKFGPARFDLIVVFYHNERKLFRKLVSALNPGGMLICKLRLQSDTHARGPPIPIRTETNSRYCSRNSTFYITRNGRYVTEVSSSLREGRKSKNSEIRLHFEFLFH